MASEGTDHICPVERAGGLNSRLRRWLQNPRRILSPWVKEGMTVLDMGCGPGFFTREMARMVGPAGRVIGCDLQEGMLDIVKDGIQGTEIQDVVTLHQCEKDRIGWSGKVDFILMFYVFHEIPDKAGCLNEMGTLLNPDGRILIVEPPFHVTKAAFEAMVTLARDAGLVEVERPRVLLSKTVILSSAKEA